MTETQRNPWAWGRPYSDNSPSAPEREAPRPSDESAPTPSAKDLAAITTHRKMDDFAERLGVALPPEWEELTLSEKRQVILAAFPAG